MEITVMAIPMSQDQPSPILIYLMECSECGPLGVQRGEAEIRASAHLMRHGQVPQ